MIHVSVRLRKSNKNNLKKRKKKEMAQSKIEMLRIHGAAAQRAAAETLPVETLSLIRMAEIEIGL